MNERLPTKPSLENVLTVILDQIRAGAISYDPKRCRLVYTSTAGNPALRETDHELMTAAIQHGLQPPQSCVFARAIEIIETPLKFTKPARITSEAQQRNVRHESTA